MLKLPCAQSADAFCIACLCIAAGHNGGRHHAMTYHPGLTCMSLLAQPVVSSAVDFFFGRVDARVPPSTTFHERLADLLLTGFTFAAEDPGRFLLGLTCRL